MLERRPKDFIRDAELIQSLSSKSSTTLLISLFLDEKDIKNLRAIKKKALFNLRYTLEDKIILGPYSNKIQLLLSAPNYFKEDTHKRYSHQTPQQKLDISWEFYNICITNEINKPAILYKLRDPALESRDWLHEIDEDINIKRNGRKYPANDKTHRWKANLAWMLGHIHQGHQFLIVSPLKKEFIKRPDRSLPYEYVASDKYSAFSKEIATAIKAGYCVADVIERKDENPHILLTPRFSKMKAVLFTMKDLDPSDQDVLDAVDMVKKTAEETIERRAVEKACCRIS